MRDLPHIRYLYVVKEIFQHRRISIAASIVHISQPAASQSLARVEDHLKNRLFERHPKGLNPTEIGIIFEYFTGLFEQLKPGRVKFSEVFVSERERKYV